MAEAIQSKPAPAGKPGLADRPTVWLVGDERDALAHLGQAIQSCNGAPEAITIEDPARLMADARPALPMLCCMLVNATTAEMRNRVSMLHKLAGKAPILLIGRSDTDIDLASARNLGAWDHASMDDHAALVDRLNQALEVGRQRRELMQTAARLNEAQRQLDARLETGDEPARARIVDGQVEDASVAFAALLGHSAIEPVLRTDAAAWLRLADRPAFSDALEQVAQNGAEKSVVCQLQPVGAPARPVRALMRPGASERQDTRPVDIVLREVDSIREQLAERTRKFPLDGRMALHHVLTNALDSEYLSGLVFVAVDGIEMLQSQFGLARSDLLLQDVGLFLLQTLRGRDRCFRFGAGEFVLLIERETDGEIAATAQRIQLAFADELFGDEFHSANLSATLTHLTLCEDSVENDRRLQRAMESAYELRREGGNVCQDCSETLADGDDQSTIAEWSTRLRDALENDRFSLAYQGITSLGGDSQPYYDILLRYIDDQGTLVRPRQFLVSAERAGLMPDIDRWVTRRAIKVIHDQRVKDVEIALFIKLSIATIVDGGAFLQWLREAMLGQEVPRRCLIFSFREEDVRTQTWASKTLAAGLDAQGFRLALTHFGNQPKADQVLANMPAAFVKLAPSFAQQVAGSDNDERLLQIIASARERKIPLIAEQIEDANSMARLWQAGVNYVQGHFIQEPDTQALNHSESPMF